MTSPPPGSGPGSSSLTGKVTDPPTRDFLHEEGLNLHAAHSKPAHPQPCVDQTTSFVSLCGRTQMHMPPVKATPAMDSPYIRGGCPLGPTPKERYRAPKNSRAGCRWGAPPPPKPELKTTAFDKIKGGKTIICANSGTKGSSPAKGGENAPSPGPRGGKRAGPHSSRPQSQARYGSYTNAQGAFAPSAKNKFRRLTLSCPPAPEGWRIPCFAPHRGRVRRQQKSFWNLAILWRYSYSSARRFSFWRKST